MKTCSRCGEVMHEALREITKVVDRKGNIDYYCKECFRIVHPKESKLFFEIELERAIKAKQEESKDARER